MGHRIQLPHRLAAEGPQLRPALRGPTPSLLYSLSVIRCAQWLNKPVMLYANGVGPVRKPINRRRVKKVVERATLVTLRDHSSARELAEMGIGRSVQVTADPVFHLMPAGAEKSLALLSSAGIPQDRPSYCFWVSSGSLDSTVTDTSSLTAWMACWMDSRMASSPALAKP